MNKIVTIIPTHVNGWVVWTDAGPRHTLGESVEVVRCDRAAYHVLYDDESSVRETGTIAVNYAHQLGVVDARVWTDSHFFIAPDEDAAASYVEDLLKATLYEHGDKCGCWMRPTYGPADEKWSAVWANELSGWTRSNVNDDMLIWNRAHRCAATAWIAWG
jgi:hypothetical protein